MEKLEQRISLATRVLGLVLLIMVTSHVAISLLDGHLCHIGGNIGANVDGDVGVKGEVGVNGDVTGGLTRFSQTDEDAVWAAVLGASSRSPS